MSNKVLLGRTVVGYKIEATPKRASITIITYDGCTITIDGLDDETDAAKRLSELLIKSVELDEEENVKYGMTITFEIEEI